MNFNSFWPHTILPPFSHKLELFDIFFSTIRNSESNFSKSCVVMNPLLNGEISDSSKNHRKFSIGQIKRFFPPQLERIGHIRREKKFQSLKTYDMLRAISLDKCSAKCIYRTHYTFQ